MIDSTAARKSAAGPLRLEYQPLYRFYEGGSLTREFRGLPAGTDDWWSEDWVGSTTLANNAAPDGSPQGLSKVVVPGLGRVSLASLVEAAPDAWIGERFAERWGTITGVLVKLLSPAGQVPLHAHPSRAWAREHLGSPFGKTEAWIILDAPGDGHEPAYAGIGFRESIDRDTFADAARRHDRAIVRDTLHRTDLMPGEVYVAHAGVPHYLGPRVSFIEVQEPSDHIVIPETDGSDDAGATMGLGWDVALGMIDYNPATRDEALGRARQLSTVVRRERGGLESRLFASDMLDFFDASRLRVEGEMSVEPGRFSVAIVIDGDGSLIGDFDDVPIRRGATFAVPASLAHGYRAGRQPLTVIRCMGPVIVD